jgi:hypothetical protein
LLPLFAAVVVAVWVVSVGVDIGLLIANRLLLVSIDDVEDELLPEDEGGDSALVDEDGTKGAVPNDPDDEDANPTLFSVE